MLDSNKKNRWRFLDYFFIMRPTLFFPLWTFFLAGCFSAQRYAVLHNHNRMLVSMGLLTLLMGAVYIINQIVDAEGDAKNDKLFFIARGIISEKSAKIQVAILLACSIAVAFLLDLKLGMMFIIVTIFTGLLYSIRPFSWKDRPILGILTNFAGGWSIVACGMVAAGYWGKGIFIRPLPYAVAIVSVFLLTTILDISGDKETEKITFGVRYGLKKTVYWALVFEIICAIISFWLREWLLFFPAVLAMPLFSIAAFKQDLKSINLAIKITVLLASLAVCAVYPFYFLLIVVNYFFSKWYYRVRFHLEYPKFAA